MRLAFFLNKYFDQSDVDDINKYFSGNKFKMLALEKASHDLQEETDMIVNGEIKIAGVSKNFFQ